MPPRFSLPRPITILVGVSLVLAAALGFDWLPFLRGGEIFHWQWPYVPADVIRALPLVLTLIVYLVGAWALFRYSERPIGLIVWSMVGAAVIPLTVIFIRHDNVLYELFARTISGTATGPHLAAAEIDWSGTQWHDWTAVMESYFGRSGHVFLSPPGLPMWYGLLNALLGTVPSVASALQQVLLPSQCQNYNLLKYTPAEWASAWFGILMPLWAALTVLPLYAVARRLGVAVRQVIAWFPLIPALIMFAPSWNTVYPLMAVLAFWWLLIGIERGKGWVLASGLLMGIMTFVNFSLIPLAGLFGFYTLLDYALKPSIGRGDVSGRGYLRPLLIGLQFAIGVMVPWVIYWFIAHGTPVEMLRQSLTAHLDLDRPYVPWLWFHSWEWALFTGIPLIVLWIAAGVQRARQWREGGSVLGLALLLTMIALVLSGTARGETGRVWLFFSPFVLLAAGEWLQRRETVNEPASSPADNTPHLETAQSSKLWFALTFAQVVLLLALVLTWTVIDAPDVISPPAAPGAQTAANAGGMTFGGQFQLASWDAHVEGNAILLTLNWRAQQPMTVPYWFGALLVYPDGHSVPNAVVWQPFDTHYPTTCWAPGVTLGDSVRLPLPDDAPAGNWWISLSSFSDDAATQLLPVTLPDGSQDRQVGLGPVSVR